MLVALLLAIGLTVAIRPLPALAVGICLFVAAGLWQATASDEGPGETPHGAAGFWLAAIVVLLPWLAGVAVGRLVTSRRAA